MFARQVANGLRNFTTTAVKRSHGPEGYPGSNLSFKIENRYRLTFACIVFFGTGFTAPFLVVRHQITK